MTLVIGGVAAENWIPGILSAGLATDRLITARSSAVGFSAAHLRLAGHDGRGAVDARSGTARHRDLARLLCPSARGCGPATLVLWSRPRETPGCGWGAPWEERQKTM